MKRIAWLMVAAACATALAQGFARKPGLWELTMVKQTMDGRDMTEQMAAARMRMQQAMANLPPEQRKQMEAMMARQGGGGPAGDGSTSRLICISPAMAARDAPILDGRSHCEPAKVTRVGDKATFEFSCAGNGRSMSGKGESTFAGDTVSTRVDTTMTEAGATHAMHSETRMTFRGADCQGIKPLDEMARDIKGPAGAKQ
jgi:hypothetical protein